MKLTRRDALAALAGAGILGGGAAAVLARDAFRDDAADGGDGSRDESGDDALSADERAVLDALVGTARVVYPSRVENVAAFVESYGGTKLAERPEYRTGAVEALDSVDAQSRITFDAVFTDLETDAERETVLRRVGADTAEPDPEGTDAEHVRYYLVNEVLFALYSSPTGGELVGIENPQGHPGGTDSYQRGPRE